MPKWRKHEKSKSFKLTGKKLDPHERRRSIFLRIWIVNLKCVTSFLSWNEKIGNRDIKAIMITIRKLWLLALSERKENDLSTMKKENHSTLN